MSELLEMSR